jgi:hypothetical protein
MNRTVVFAIVALAAASAQAQMTKVADTGDRSFYLDTKSIEGTGNVRRVPIVEDYATAQVNGMRSRRMMLEVDCGGVQVRGLSSTDYAEPMAAGKTLASSNTPSDWLYVGTPTGSLLPPQTPYRTIWQSVCR